jgi:hypothetical protein
MVYAQITNNKIINIIELHDASLLSLFQTDQNGNPYDSVIQIDLMNPQPGIGWTFDNVNWNNPNTPAPAENTVEIYTTLVQNAITFGNALIVQFATQNVMAGITQAGQTQAVLAYAGLLYTYLSTGSLYVAIAEIETMIADTSSTKTALAPFITNNVLYSYLNQIQGYLGLPITPNPGP